MTRYKVAVARFPGDGWERKECTAWLINAVGQMRADRRISGVESLCYSDTPIPMCRNKAVVEARLIGADYLLMVDSDMAPDAIGPQPFWPTAWEFMLRRRDQEATWAESDWAVREPGDGDPREEARRAFPPATIAAPYCGPPPEELCYIFEWKNRQSDHPNPDWYLEMIPRAAAALRGGIAEVAALPTGLILYDMRVFDRLPPPWFDYEWTDEFHSQKASTEDVYQTRNASLLGLPQYVVWDSWSGHVKDKTVGKPTIVTRDMVHDSLRQAVLRGADRGDRLMILKEGPFVFDDSKRHVVASTNEACPFRERGGLVRRESCAYLVGEAAIAADGRCVGCLVPRAVIADRRDQSIPRSPEGLADCDLEAYYPSGGDHDFRTDGS